MHIALSIPEIVSELCNALLEDNGAREGEGPYTICNARALAVCARTCRAFHVPAIKALWKDDRLTLEIVLLHCMPQDIWEVQRGAPGYYSSKKIDKYTLGRAIRSSDLDRLVYYAPLVNKLTFGSAAHLKMNVPYGKNLPELSDECYLALSLAFPGPIFPNLRHLVWNDQSAKLDHMLPFLSPNAVSLDITTHYTGASLMTVLSHLPMRCPTITNFTFLCDRWNSLADIEVVERTLAITVCSWSLRNFRSRTADHTTIRHLSRCPSLETLWIYRDRLPSWNLPSIELGHVAAFASLRTMFLHKASMKRNIELMQGCAFNNLEELRIRLEHPSTGEWPALFRAIRDAHARPHIMHTLEINEWRADLPTDFRDPVRDADVEPLLAFVGLRDLDLECTGGFDFADETVQRMAETWPRLKNLRLYAKEPATWERHLTLDALASLAMHCPDLQCLEIEVDATGVTYDRNPPRPAKPPSLSSISFHWSPITSARVVAGFLSVIFPNLTDTDANEDADEAAKKRWRRVGSTAKLFAMLREQERMDALGEIPSDEHLEVDDTNYISASESEIDDDE
ncbi:hypothetical protein BD626DRAFT_410696 [Schizophyllum amplum]|uniref:F-box domain-containing protein n=1 Tax=Schizophyllum amplum TaxID=97359 RepID=A0A550C0J7_9AGAR|nr:hypothetical protein BD626DRAFT_410696 [Auriculariopsis ampla]